MRKYHHKWCFERGSSTKSGCFRFQVDDFSRFSQIWLCQICFVIYYIFHPSFTIACALYIYVLVCILTVYTQIVKCVSKVHMIQIWRCISISMCIYLYLFSKPTSQALDAEAPLRTWHVCMGDLRPTHGNVTVWKMLMIDQIWRKWWDIVDIVV